MKFRTLALGLTLALAALAPAHAQRGAGGGWELLGEEQVNLGNDRDVIRLNHDENFYRNKAYRKLRFVASGGEVRMKTVRLVYLNGHAETVDFSQTLKPGQDVDLDLRGERSYLRQIEMNYRSKLGISIGGGGIRLAQPTIRVFGENVRAAPPPPPLPPVASHPGGRSFEEITRSRFDRRDGRVYLAVGRREGRFGRIMLRNVSGDDVEVTGLVAEFGNGDRQRVNLRQRLGRGDQTGPVDLEGDRRFLRGVTVELEPRRRPGPVEIALLGSERPGRDDGGRPGPGGYRPNPSWQLLGQQAVGIRGDRDVIRVEKPADFYRDRGFDKLHFVSENADVHLMSVRIVYLNGYAEDLQVNRLVRAGSDLAVDLPGRRSYLREIEVTQRKLPGQRGRAIVSVYGEQATRRR